MLALAGFAAAKQQQDRGFTERVEVNIRTVLAVVTDSKGQPLATPLTAQDVLVLEDGIPARVIAVELIRPPAPPPPARPEAPAPPAEPAPKPAIERVPQVLYLDATLLMRQSPKRIAGAIRGNLEALLARGPFAIVVADPDPKSLLPPTSDLAVARRALADLEKNVVGRERLREVRHELERGPGTIQLSQKEFDAGARSRALRAKMAIQQEIQLIRQSFDRLERWAADQPTAGPTVLFLASDGFDSNPTDFYENWLRDESGRGNPEAAQVRAAFQGQIPEMVAHTSQLLANRSMLTVPLAVGNADASFSNDAASVGHLEGNDVQYRPLFSPPTLTFVRPLEPLRLIADATGGEVLTREDKLDALLDRLARAVAITYRMDRPPDGKPHKLEVRSRREGVVIRAAHSVVSERPEAVAAARSIEAFAAPGNAGNLPVRLSVNATGLTPKGRLTGTLLVTADFAEFLPALQKLGPGRLRVTIAAEAKGSRPFVQRDEVDLNPTGGGRLWTYEAPMEWPLEATRVAVTVEEIKTGARGVAVIPLPAAASSKPAPQRAPDPSQPALPVRVSVDQRTADGERLRLTVNVTTEIIQILQPLAQAGGARLNIEVVAESPSGSEVVASVVRSLPFQDVDDLIVPLEISCLSSTRQLVVTVQEEVTWRRGRASVRIAPAP